MRCEEKNTLNKSEENEPEKLNKLLITGYAKVKNKEQEQWQPHASHDSYTFPAFKGTRIPVFHDNRDFKSHTFLLEAKGVRMLSLRLLLSEDLY